MSEIPLSDEETKVIFAEESRDNLAELDPTKQAEVINRLLNIVRSASDPSRFIYEKIRNLDIIRVGDQIRLYTKVVVNVPEGNKEYHAIYIFYIDDKHDYDHNVIATFSRHAQATLSEITNLDTVGDVEAYMDSHDALGEEDLADLLC